ncbi:MAG: hypothetical protein KKC03_06565 [Bacteroidetes bacterium]|nr:hypothetical protein [Bacteroidota bacterium]
MGTTKIGAEQLRGVARQFPPFFSEITPNFTTPNTQIEATIKGEFFTPDMTVFGNGFTVNNFIFIDTKTVKFFIMTAGVDGNYGITLDNGSGTPTVKNNVFTVSQGNVIVPTLADWTFVSAMNTADLNTPGEVKITANGQLARVRWNQVIDMSRKWRVVFSAEVSPFNAEITALPIQNTIYFLNEGDNTTWTNFRFNNATSGRHYVGDSISALAVPSVNITSAISNTGILSQTAAFYTLEWDLTSLKWYNENNVLQTTVNAALPVGNLKFEVRTSGFNVDSIKYIELP